MIDQTTRGATVSGEEAGRWTDPAVDVVCGRFAPFWPLDAMVATNPYLGFVDQDFDAAAEYHRRIIGRPMTMRRDWFLEQIAAGRITDADLEEALAHSGSDLDLAGLRGAAEEPVPLALPQLLFGRLAGGDVLDDADIARYMSRWIDDWIASVGDPADRAVGTYHAVFVLKRQPHRLSPAEHGQHLFPVIRVNGIQE